MLQLQNRTEHNRVRLDIAAGDTCFIPRGAVHGFNNLKPASARALAVVTPALIGPEYFREMAAIVNAGGPPDLEKIEAVMTRHGLVPAPPQKIARCERNFCQLNSVD